MLLCDGKALLVVGCSLVAMCFCRLVVIVRWWLWVVVVCGVWCVAHVLLFGGCWWFVVRRCSLMVVSCLGNVVCC